MSNIKPWKSPTVSSSKTFVTYDINTSRFGRITDTPSLTVFQDTMSNETTPFRVGWRRSVKNGRVDTTLEKTPYEDTDSKVVTSIFVTEAMYSDTDSFGKRVDTPSKVQVRVELPANGLVPEADLFEQVELTLSLTKDKLNEALLSEVRMGGLTPSAEV